MDNANLPVPTVAATLPMAFARAEALCEDVIRCANVNLSPSQRENLLGMIAELKRLLAPASETVLRTALAQLSLACKHGQSEATERRAFALLMLVHMREYPADILHAACLTWVRERVFFPAIAEFRALCEPALRKRQRLLATYERALSATPEGKLNGGRE
jgi:hypothetical protein